MQADVIIERTQHWISQVVIGLNLCPFARRVVEGHLIRYVVCEAQEIDKLQTQLIDELLLLAGSDAQAIETTFLIHPFVLREFLDYNDFVVESETVLEQCDLVGTIQIAGFHPHYQFAGSGSEDVVNYTNRSPFPMLHLLREASVTAVNQDPVRTADIPRRNIETLRRLGLTQVQKLSRGEGAEAHE